LIGKLPLAYGRSESDKFTVGAVRPDVTHRTHISLEASPD
jgi:hypothetical protein